MKSRHIISCAISVTALALGFLFLSALRKHNVESNRIQRMPQITLCTIDGEVFSPANLTPLKNTAILFFSPDCEFCQKEIDGILANASSFTGTIWIFVTLSSRDDLTGFLMERPIGSIPDAKICMEETPRLFTTFDVTAPPSLFIYNAYGKLEHHKYGAVSIKTILEWLK